MGSPFFATVREFFGLYGYMGFGYFVNIFVFLEHQGEIQRLRDKLAISERTVKAETQLRDKFKLRLKILEDGLNGASSLTIKGAEKSDQVNGFRSCSGTPRKRSASQPGASVAGTRTSIQQQPGTASFLEPSRKVVQIDSLMKKFSAGENLVRRNLWASRSKFFDDHGKENTEGKINSDGDLDVISPGKEEVSKEVKASGNDDSKSLTNGNLGDGSEDLVSDFLYDRLQKEVIDSRK